MRDRLSRRTFLGATGATAVAFGAASLYDGRTAALSDSAHLFEKST